MIQEEMAIAMDPHCGGGAFRTHRAHEHAQACLVLLGSRHGTDKMPSTHQGWDRQGDRVLGNQIKVRKTSIMHLLHPTLGIEGDDLHRHGILQVCHRGVIEGNVSILSIPKDRSMGASINRWAYSIQEASDHRIDDHLMKFFTGAERLLSVQIIAEGHRIL